MGKCVLNWYQNNPGKGKSNLPCFYFVLTTYWLRWVHHLHMLRNIPSAGKRVCKLTHVETKQRVPTHSPAIYYFLPCPCNTGKLLFSLLNEKQVSQDQFFSEGQTWEMASLKPTYISHFSVRIHLLGEMGTNEHRTHGLSNLNILHFSLKSQSAQVLMKLQPCCKSHFTDG